MQSSLQDLLTTLAAAQLAGRSAETIRVWERIGRLPAIRTTSGQRLFTREAVLQAAAKAKPRRGEDGR